MALEGGEVARAFVTIIPEFTEFDRILQAKLTASLAAVEKQTAAAAASATAAGAGGLGRAAAFKPLEDSAAGAAKTINGQMTPALNGVKNAAGQAGREIERTNLSVGGLTKSIKGLTKLGPALIAAFSVKVFADFEKATKTAAIVFGDSADEIIAFSKGINKELGTTAAGALQFATNIGNAIQGVGFSARTTTAATEALTTRVADVAAALSRTPQQIATAFQLAIEGNTRGLKQLGITISGLDTQNKALALGFKGSFSDLSDAQKAAVLYSLVLERTNKFQGQAAATADTFRGRMRTLKGELGDTALSIGRNLAPAVGSIVGLFAGLFNIIGKIPGPLLAAATAAGVAALAFGTLSKIIGSEFVTSLFTAESALLAVAPEVVIFSVAVGALVGAFAIFGNKTVTLEERLKSLGDTASITGTSLQDFLGKDTFANLKDLDDLRSSLGDLKTAADDAARSGLGGGSRAQFNLSTQMRAIEAAGKATAKSIDLVRTAVDEGHVVDLRAAIAKADLASSIKDKLNKAVDDEILKVQQANKDNAASALILANSGEAVDDYATSLDRATDAISDLLTDSDAFTKAVKNHQKAVDDVTAAEDNLRKVRAESDAAEVAKGVEKLGEASDTVATALERQAIAQKALDDLKKPATERELAEMADKVAEAEIGVARATRARDEALKALNRTTGRSINLTGLSLDQLRTTLANARATLAAQRTTATDDPAVLQENATQAEIDLRQAKNKVLDAQQEQFDLQNKLVSNADKILGAEHELNGAKAAVTRATNNQIAAQKELTALQAGQTEHAVAVQKAQEKVAEARERERDAAEDVQSATAKQKDDTDAILGANLGITREMQAQVIAANDMFQANAALRRSLVTNVLGQLGVPIGPFSQGFIDKIFEAIKSDPAKFKSTLKDLGVTVPGAAHGAVITKPGMWQLGEWSRPEVVLPLTKPDRAWELIKQSLPHMAMPLRRRMEDVISQTKPSFDIGTVAPAGVLDRPVTEATSLKILDRLDELIHLLEGKPGGAVTVEVKPHAGMSEAALVRKTTQEVMRHLNG